jgi:hypothetical protein
MAKRKLTRMKRAGKKVGALLKTMGEGVQYFARGIKFFASFAGEFKDGVKEGRRG